MRCQIKYTALVAAIWLTPFGGYRTSGSLHLDDPNYSRVEMSDKPVYGLAAGVDVPEGLVELMWTHQDSEARVIPNAGSTAPLEGFSLNTDQLHFNGLYFPPGFDHAQPYVLAGLGATRYSPVGDAEAMSRFSWALGGGVHVPIAKRLGLRLEAKWNPALSSSSNSVFCNSATGRCFVSSSGELVNQFDFTAGLTVRL